jgi:hypothetical protein
MTEYRVRIFERAAHELNVEARSEDDAIDLAYKILTAGMSEQDKLDTDYVLEFVEYTGSPEAEEI